MVSFICVPGTVSKCDPDLQDAQCSKRKNYNTGSDYKEMPWTSQPWWHQLQISSACFIFLYFSGRRDEVILKVLGTSKDMSFRGMGIQRQVLLQTAFQVHVLRPDNVS